MPGAAIAVMFSALLNPTSTDARRRQPWRADLFAVAITAATFGVRMAISDQLNGLPTLVIFTVPIMASGYFGGLRSGLVATLIAYLGASYFLLEPFHTFAVASGAERWQQFFIVLAGIVISGLNEALHRTRRRSEAHEAEIARLSRLYAALSQVNHAIVWTPEREGLFRKVCEVLVEHGGFHVAWIGWHDSATHSLVPVASAGGEDDFFRDLRILVDSPQGSGGPVETAFREQRPCISNDVLVDPAAQSSRRQLEALGIRAVAALPIRENGEVAGTLVVYSDAAHFFQDKEIALLTEAAVDVSFALDNLAREAARQLAVEEVKASEGRFRALFDQAAVGICVVGMDYRIGRVNERFAEIVGYSRDELLASGNCVETTHPDDKESDRAAVASLLAGERSVSLEKRYLRKNGTVVWARLVLSLLRSSAGDAQQFLGIVSDITARKAAEEGLRRSEASLANAQSIARIGNWDFDIVTGALSWSAEIYRIFGVDPSTFRVDAKSFMALVHPEDRARVEAAHHGAIQGKASQDLQHRIVRPDGTVRIVHELAAARHDLEDQSKVLSGTVQDITERVQAEAKLRESEETFAAAFRASPMAMVITTQESRFVEVNQAYCDLVGLPREEILGRTAVELGLLGASERQEAVAMLERSGGTLGGLELELRHRDGNPRRVISGVTEITLHGVRHRLSTAIDVTEQRRAERALRESELRYRRLFETSKDGIVILDAATGKVVDVNPYLLTLLNVQLEDFLDKAIWELVFFKEVVANRETFMKLRDTEYLRFPHLPLETGAGAQIEVEFVSTVYEVNGRKVVQCSVRDVTARRQAELALRELNTTLELRVVERTAQLEAANRELAAHASSVSHDLRVAEAADRLKSAFLATMSHELRTPLNSIIGFTGILIKGMAGPLNAEQTKQLGMVRGSARHLLELINDVLDLSKIEAGQLEVRSEPFDLRTSIYRVMASVAPLTESKPLKLTLDLPPELGEMVSDRRRVEQILLNLVTNAIKFTQHGTVTLSVELLGGPKSSVRLQVADTGIGIAPADLATLFQPFRQIDSGLARQSEGTGLGLAICRRLATLLGGEISATSDPGRGSEFTVTLPLQTSP